VVECFLERQKFVRLDRLGFAVFADALFFRLDPEHGVADGFEFLFLDGGHVSLAEHLAQELIPHVGPESLLDQHQGRMPLSKAGNQRVALELGELVAHPLVECVTGNGDGHLDAQRPDVFLFDKDGLLELGLRRLFFGKLRLVFGVLRFVRGYLFLIDSRLLIDGGILIAHPAGSFLAASSGRHPSPPDRPHLAPQTNRPRHSWQRSAGTRDFAVVARNGGTAQGTASLVRESLLAPTFSRIPSRGFLMPRVSYLQTGIRQCQIQA